MHAAVLTRPAPDLTVHQQAVLEQAEARIVGYAQRGKTAIIGIGEELAAAKQAVGHGHFIPWLERLGIPQRTAWRYMRVAEIARSATEADLPELEIGVLFELAAAPVRSGAADAILERAAAGERLDRDRVREEIDRYREEAEDPSRADGYPMPRPPDSDVSRLIDALRGIDVLSRKASDAAAAVPQALRPELAGRVDDLMRWLSAFKWSLMSP